MLVVLEGTMHVHNRLGQLPCHALVDTDPHLRMLGIGRRKAHHALPHRYPACQILPAPAPSCDVVSRIWQFYTMSNLPSCKYLILKRKMYLLYFWCLLVEITNTKCFLTCLSKSSIAQIKWAAQVCSPQDSAQVSPL